MTQAYKRERIAESGLALPGNLKFVAVDFTTETMDEGLWRSGLDPARPLFASWLGCAPYLTRAQIVQAMRPLAAWPGGAEIEQRCGFPRQDLLRLPFEMLFHATSPARMRD